jgi:GNAT superfamily N-acetyltransferase
VTEISISLATEDDVAVIQELLLQLGDALGKSDDITGTEQDLMTFGFGDRAQFEALLAFDGDTAAGLVVFFPEYSTWRGMPGVYIQDLFVVKAYRGKGVGRKLISATRERSRSWGGRYVKLSVYEGNEAAITFYQSLGFELRDDEQVLVMKD